MNILKLNENETKIMEINLNSEGIFKINDAVIENLEYVEFLGFIIDKKLNVNEKINYLFKKVGNKNYIHT